MQTGTERNGSTTGNGGAQLAGSMPAVNIGIAEDDRKAVAEGLSRFLSDAFTLYLKTKGFHWHISGRHFRDYHLLLDEQAEQIFAMTDDIAERARKIGG